MKTLPPPQTTPPNEDPTSNLTTCTSSAHLTSVDEHLTSVTDPTDLSDVSVGSSENSSDYSVTAPSISPLHSAHSYSCGSPTTPSPTHCEQAAMLTTFELPRQPSPRHEKHDQHWCGFKLVMDNIDMNITPAFQRVDKVKQSLHYVTLMR